MSRTRVDALGRGRVWSGDVAQREGLVDRLGGLGAALARARELGGLDAESSVVVVPRRPASLLDFVLGEALEPAARTRANDAALRVSGMPALDAEALADEALPAVDASVSPPLAVPAALRALFGAVVALEQVQAGGAVARLPWSLRAE
jgi:ClpP class serine protease